MKQCGKEEYCTPITLQPRCGRDLSTAGGMGIYNIHVMGMNKVILEREDDSVRSLLCIYQKAINLRVIFAERSFRLQGQLHSGESFVRLCHNVATGYAVTVIINLGVTGVFAFRTLILASRPNSRHFARTFTLHCPPR